MNALREMVRDHWRALGSDAPQHATQLAVTDMAVVTVNGPLSAALDGDGRRHLLVPLASAQTLDSDTRSAGVHLVVRELVSDGRLRRYGDLVLNDSRLADVFTSLCADVVAAIAAAPTEPVGVTKDVLNAWRALLDAARVRLGPGGAAGLFGELVVLDHLLGVDSGSVAAWTGPFGASHDFHRLGAGIEVKATTAIDGMSFRVHGLDQLDPGSGRLWLAWLRLERHPEHGLTIPEAVDRVLARADDRRRLLDALAHAGYSPGSADELSAMRFSVVEERWYEVTPEFPRLVVDDLRGARPPVGVSDVHYTVDLADAGVDPVDGAIAINTLLGAS